MVNFDFPYNPVDYLHRTGRTARAGQKGRVTSLVAKGDQVLAGRIDQALQQGLPMDELSADRKSLPPNMRSVIMDGFLATIVYVQQFLWRKACLVQIAMHAPARGGCRVDSCLAQQEPVAM